MQGIKTESTLDGSREHLAMTECVTRLPKVVQQLHVRAQLSVYLQRRLWNPCHCRLRQSGGITPPYSLLFAFYYLSFVDTCIVIMAKYQNKSQ